MSTTPPSDALSPSPPVLSRRSLLALAFTLTVPPLSCRRFPQDPRHTLDNVRRRGHLRVGWSESRPWVIRGPDDQALGLEAFLIETFARELHVSVQGHWAGAEGHLHALQQHELDLVIGGFTADNPWQKHVAFTFPYYTTEKRVGVSPDRHPRPSSLKGMTVTVRSGSGLEDKLRRLGAHVQLEEDLTADKAPLVAFDWELEGMGLVPLDPSLRTYERVIAVPRGENAFIMLLEDALLKIATADLLKGKLAEMQAL